MKFLGVAICLSRHASISLMISACLASSALAQAVSASSAPHDPTASGIESTQEVVEEKSDSQLTYRMVVVLPAFFHGYATDRFSGVAAAAPARITDYVKQQKIDLAAMIRGELDQRLRSQPDVASRLQKQMPLRVQLKYRYGISKFALSGYKPYVAMAIAIADSSGAVLWKGSDHVGAVAGLGSTQSMEYEAFFSSPDTFRTAYDGAIKQLVQSMVSKIKLPQAP